MDCFYGCVYNCGFNIGFACIVWCQYLSGCIGAGTEVTGASDGSPNSPLERESMTKIADK